MSRAAWEAFLTEMEDDLDAGEEAVRSGSTTLVPQWQAPTDLGPLPAELEERTRSLVSRIDLLSTFVKYQLAAIDADIEHARHQQQHKATQNKAIALFLDASV